MNECPTLIKEKLQDFEKALRNLPKSASKNYELAKEKCPSLLSDNFKLMFLRCEVFRVKDAAVRLAQYWDKRVDIFGPSKAFQPLTQTGALKGDECALEMGLARLLPFKDPSGRSIIYFDPSRRDKTKVGSREEIGRAIWYVLHKALAAESAQQRGLVVLLYPRNAKLSQFDQKLDSLLASSIRGCIPCRIGGFHVCHPSTFAVIIWPIVKIFLGERLRKRVKMWSGSEEKVMDDLTKFGITPDMVPSDMGGKCVLDHTAWLQEQAKEEASQLY